MSQRGRRPRPWGRSLTIRFPLQLSPEGLLREAQTERLPGCFLLFSAPTILAVYSFVVARGPSQLVKVVKNCFFSCPCVVEVEVRRPKEVNEQSIHIHSCAAIVHNGKSSFMIFFSLIGALVVTFILDP